MMYKLGIKALVLEVDPHFKNHQVFFRSGNEMRSQQIH